MQNVLLEDVAREARTSVSTVSRVLNDRWRGQIAEPTSRRVRQAADRLGYTVNHAARAMRIKRTMTLGLSVRDLRDPAVGGVVQEIESDSHRHGFEVLLGIERDQPMVELRRLADRQVDGLILIRGATVHDPDGVIERLVDEGIPLVCIGPQPHPAVPAVDWDRRAGARDLAETMVQRGARSLLLIGESDTPGMRQREQGLREAAADRDATVSTHLIGQRERSIPHADQARGLEPIAQRLDRERPGGVIVQSEHQLGPVLTATRRLGLRVPADLMLAVASTADHAEWLDPPPTALHIDQPRLARLAVQQLRQLIVDHDHPPQATTRRVQPTVDWRASTHNESPPHPQGDRRTP